MLLSTLNWIFVNFGNLSYVPKMAILTQSSSQLALKTVNKQANQQADPQARKPVPKPIGWPASP